MLGDGFRHSKGHIVGSQEMLECTFGVTVLLTAFIPITGLFIGGTNSAKEKGRPGDSISGETNYSLLFLTSIVL